MTWGWRRWSQCSIREHLPSTPRLSPLWSRFPPFSDPTFPLKVPLMLVHESSGDCLSGDSNCTTWYLCLAFSKYSSLTNSPEASSVVAKFDGPSGSSLVFTSSSERCSVKLHYWGIIPAPMRHGWIFSPSQTYKLAPNFSLNMVFLIWQIRQDRWPIFGNFHSKQASYSLWKTSCRVCVCLCFK